MKFFGVIDGIQVAITDHALSRLVEMKIEADEIRKLITEPEEKFSSTKYPEGKCYRRGDYTLAIVPKNDVLVICTALYSTKSAWLKANRDNRLGEGCEIRLDTGIPNF